MTDFLVNLGVPVLTVVLLYGYDVKEWWAARAKRRAMKKRKPTRQEIDELMREIDAL